MSFEILPQGLAIRAMRSNGYKNTAYALAELIDNSIQAGEEINQMSNVEVICIDITKIRNERPVTGIDKIIIYDDACGMEPELLRKALQFGVGTRLEKSEQKGIGKFGMGLPNSSISQCCKVEIWSWRDGNPYYTYLDIDEIESEKMKSVPEPVNQDFPEELQPLIKSKIKDHGTLVLWTKLDRIKWKTSKALFDNSENLVGRMYRHFIKDSDATIRLASFEQKEGANKLLFQTERYIKPNDPMYLMKNTSAPPPYDKEPAFCEYKESDEIEIKLSDGTCSKVMINYSFCRKETRNAGGSSPIGKHTAKNQGISIVRAKREIEMKRYILDISDTRERWWGVEICFEPSLDQVMGVTNNKQSATNFELMDLAEDAKIEGISPVQFKKKLEEENDDRCIFYDISTKIFKSLDPMRKVIKGMGNPRKDQAGDPGSPEYIAQRALEKRKKKVGDIGDSDKSEKKPDKDKMPGLTKNLKNDGNTEEEATQKATAILTKNVKFLFREAEMHYKLMFDYSDVEGVLIITLNTKHPAYPLLFDLLDRGKR